MPRSPDLPCAGCGRLMWRGKGTLPEGQAKCRDCRRGDAPGAKAGTTKKRPLRAVRDGEKAAPATTTKPDQGQDSDGDDDDDGCDTTPEALRRRLVAIKRRVSVVIDDPSTPVRELGVLIRRELELTEKIQALDLASGKKGSVIASTGNESWNQSAI